MTANTGTAVLVVDGGDAGRALIARLRRRGVECAVLESPDLDFAFHPQDDLWRVGAGAGRTVATRVVVTGRPPWPEADTADAFLGLAAHGFPNLFRISETSQVRYLADCVALLGRRGATRIEVRAAVQWAFGNWSLRRRDRALRGVDPDHFDLTCPADREPREDYRGPGELVAGGVRIPVTVALSGHTEPIDGKYHWYGRIAAQDAVIALSKPGAAPVTITLPEGSPTPARLAEVDPWGNVRVTGVGAPPYRLESLEDIDGACR